MSEFRIQYPHYAPVSPNVPLISNLTAWQNVSLIAQYHDRLSEREAWKQSLSYLERLDLHQCAEKRPPELSPEESFAVMTLRASMIHDAIILVCDPFRLLAHHLNATFIYNVLKRLDDLYTQCHIFDYLSNKERYRTNDAQER